MQGSKKARHASSIMNNTKNFGIMGGLAPRTGIRDVAAYRHVQIKGSKGLPQLNGKTITYQKNYLFKNKLVSKNPAYSGGVGKRVLFR